MNLAVAVREASMEAVKATQANVTHDMNERRVVAAAPADFAAAGLGGGAAVGFEGAGETSLLIGISQEIYELQDHTG
jgi:hypothetical protein